MIAVADWIVEELLFVIGAGAVSNDVAGARKVEVHPNGIIVGHCAGVVMVVRIDVDWCDDIARISVYCDIGSTVVDVCGAPVTDIFAHVGN